MLDEEPLLSDHLLALAEWMAQYYLAPLGEVLRGMLPLMAEVRRTVYYRITDLGRDVLAGSLDGDSGGSRSENPDLGHPGFEFPGLESETLRQAQGRLWGTGLGQSPEEASRRG